MAAVAFSVNGQIKTVETEPDNSFPVLFGGTILKKAMQPYGPQLSHLFFSPLILRLYLILPEGATINLTVR
jgi:hypothetical protein